MRAYKFLDEKFGIKSLQEKRLKISVLDDLNDPFELLPYQMTDRNKRAALNATRRQMASNRGLLCFSATWKDPVLWAHYADKHKGLCLAFDVPQETCRAVTYEKRRLKLPAKPSLPDAEALIFTKYVNWQYEQELRIWASLNTCDHGLYFADFGPTLRLEKVIAGARCSLSEMQITRAIEPLLERVILIKARAGFKEFEIVKDQLGFRN
jgi:Protein of unknown function (DUF2971)